VGHAVDQVGATGADRLLAERAAATLH
jgi:hypothetical protein